MNNPTNPERIDPYKGTYFVKEIHQKNELSIWAVGCDGDSHVADFTGSNARKMAEEYRDWKNTMQPAQPSADAVECARCLEIPDYDSTIGGYDSEELEKIVKQNAFIIQQHTDARVADLTQHNTECVGKILEHAFKMQSTWEFERLVQLLPEDNQTVQDAIAIRKWADQKEHNKAEFDRCEEGKVYLCYDHYRNAFWGPNRGGYCYRRTAGHYDKKGVGEIILGSNRYFTVEEVPANIIAALASQGGNGER
jgi:hypothetical protein